MITKHVAVLIKIFWGAIIMGVCSTTSCFIFCPRQIPDMGRIGFASSLIAATFYVLHFAPPPAADSAPAGTNPEPLQFSNKVVRHVVVPASSEAGTATVLKNSKIIYFPQLWD